MKEYEESLFELKDTDELDKIDNWQDKMRLLGKDSKALMEQILKYILYSSGYVFTERGLYRVGLDFYAAQYERQDFDSLKPLVSAMVFQVIDILEYDEFIKKDETHGGYGLSVLGIRRAFLGKEGYERYNKLQRIASKVKKIKHETLAVRLVWFAIFVIMLIILVLVYGIKQTAS